MEQVTAEAVLLQQGDWHECVGTPPRGWACVDTHHFATEEADAVANFASCG